MHLPSTRRRAALPAAVLAAWLGAVVATPACAQGERQGQSQVRSEDAAASWRFAASVYGYFPSLGAQSRAPTSPDGPTIDIDAGRLLDALEFTFMGAFTATRGRYGVFTDLVYLDLGGERAGTRDFTIGENALPATTTADLGWELRGLMWTVAGEVQAWPAAAPHVWLLGGVRMFRLEPTTRWSVQGDLAGIPPEARTGSHTARETLWDAIVGVRGRVPWGAGSPWSSPYHLDVGTGESRLTWQAAVGITRAFGWGDVTAMWRHVGYDIKSGPLEKLTFDGPLVGATFRW